MPDTWQMRLQELEVAVVENDPLALRGLVASLEQLGCTIAWTAHDDETAVAAADTHLPGIAFVDLKLHQGHADYQPGWQLIKHLYRRASGRPFTAIIHTGTPMTDEILLEAVRMGCSYIVKEDLWNHELEVLAAALLAAASGSVYLSHEVAASLETVASRSQAENPLSPKEWEVLSQIAEGMSNQEIARRQFVEISTVKSQVSSILGKLKVKNRHQAAAWYRRHKEEGF